VADGKLTPESPERLRECLNALAAHCGHDVFRVEVVSRRGSLRVIVTSSREAREEDIARIIVAQLAMVLSSEQEAAGG
jgi:hypothetical protein